MVSPICLVNGNPTTPDGITVNPGDTITITLSDVAGVSVWSIKCINTDDNHDKTTINNSMSVDYVLKEASFTMPNDISGTTLIFESIVNNGIDVNGQLHPEWRVRFGIQALTVGGYAVMAFGEKTEFNAGFGWTSKFNDAVRGVVTPPGSAGLGLYFSGNAYNIGTADASIVVNADDIQVGVISDAQHGNLSGGSLHAAATTLSNGFMSAADKTKLDNAAYAANPNTLALRNGSGNIQFNVTYTEGMDSVGTTLSLQYSNTNANVSFFSNSANFQSGRNIIFIKDAGTAPSANPTGGVFLYSLGARLYARTSAGNFQLV